MTAAIELLDLVVTRGNKTVLAGVTAEITAGSITGLLGPSGSGKTTLMRAVIGVQKIRSGRILVLGQSAGSPPLRHRVGYVSQAPSVYGDLSIRSNVEFFAAIYGCGKSAVDDVLNTVGLQDYAARRTSLLSEGQRSRVSLACALVAQPEVLILDEPTVGLDPLLRLELWNEFERLAADGMALLVSSHVMDEAKRCQSLLLLRDGALLANLSPEELADRTGTVDMDEAFLRLVSGSGRSDQREAR
ncbi:ABC transporter ATP-binding protein [Saxibacter everestensis]|uniref:ABC transporter ATP-binding protein n=1 Tax=Saxibacter everestensis TaxID=2909229 RepID=A0ABY8QSR3_9MICO|nr:ABC transporter ATP-binding protein [Brevibacteriaceae bacterium ZFBP1038]